MLNKGTLVLEGVTLAQVVELVVEVLVDLSGGAVLDEQAAEDTQATHPHDLTVSNVSANRSMNVHHCSLRQMSSPVQFSPAVFHTSQIHLFHP